MNLFGTLWLILSSFLFSQNSFSKQNTEEITLHYYDRPPFMFEKNHMPTGLTADLVLQIFKDADVPYKLKKTPARRQLRILKENQGSDCSLGFKRSQERDLFAQFTLPIYLDGPWVLISSPRLNLSSNIETVFGNKHLLLILFSRFTYGPRIEELLMKYSPKTLTIDGEVSRIYEMVKNGRADIAVVTKEEAEYQDKAHPGSFRIYNFPEFGPYGENRYIMCSKKVSQNTMMKLNNTIQRLRLHITSPK
ncbi:type 2 periplasmic-binding domain-containing protein [Bdellovibrio reynosensis]|uniref:Transporter substrate-binding domain-containing protein n=1 Tax=Bdellovibrio reynosensis TaxID=2835041 RepID=A0ABY4CDN1_9BACT|nr:transporter substrate-binding domain-containing protein [Bdellovibrio reynosensis]UOF01771.1 transporter substrate-binding domain-containing protein [Bdellovibrio reynosensis]